MIVIVTVMKAALRESQTKKLALNTALILSVVFTLISILLGEILLDHTTLKQTHSTDSSQKIKNKNKITL